ncbi:Srp72p [Coemansia sp. 'formosensis']|nr:Srp72p [Coemansia sp. 'formosensis']
MSKQSLETHFSAVRDALVGGNLPAVFEAARSGLSDYPKEADFAKIQIVALIKQEKAQQALNLIDQAHKSKFFSSKDMAYEAAYCHFVIGNYDLAKRQLKNASPGPLVAKLAAQIAYKNDQFAECVDIYAALISKTERGSQEYNDLVLNMSAAKAAAVAQHSQDPGAEDAAATDTVSGGYELMFNSATRLLGSGRAQEAVTLLAEAEKLAASTLADDKWSEKDIRSEVGPIEAQRAVALHQLGRTSEARTIYVNLLSERALDVVTRDVVIHNCAAVGMAESSGSDVSASTTKRALQVPGRSAGSLSRHQKTLMVYNMAVMQAAQKQYVAARRSLRVLEKMTSGVAIANAGALSAAISLHMGRGRQALNELAAISFSQEPISGVRPTLAAAQVAIQLGDNKRAADILQVWKGKAQGVDFGNLKLPAKFVHHYFGVCLIYNWLQSKPDVGKSETEAAAEAAKHLYTKVAMMQQQSVELLVAVGGCLSYAGIDGLARECFGQAQAAASEHGLDSNVSSHMSIQTLLAPDSDPKLTAQLLRCYKRRARLARDIPGLPARMARRFQPVGSAPRKGNTATMLGAKHNRSASLSKRRSRRNRKLATSPPKNYEVGRILDAERWIPMRQRSYYKPRGRGHRQAKLRGGAQGGTVEASSGLGGTGSARIGGKDVSPALLQTPTYEGVPAVSMPVSGSHSSKSKSKGGKSGNKSGKGKKGSW